jgi:hypothetical protein
MELFDPQGHRLYLTAEEREAFIATANNAQREVRTFCLVLAYTGCRISDTAVCPFHPLIKRTAGCCDSLFKRDARANGEGSSDAICRRATDAGYAVGIYRDLVEKTYGAEFCCRKGKRRRCCFQRSCHHPAGPTNARRYIAIA